MSIIQKSLLIISVAIFLVWLAIWNGLQFEKYEWVYSTNITIKSFQYLIQGAWTCITILCPIWVIWGVMFAYHFCEDPQK